MATTEATLELHVMSGPEQGRELRFRQSPVTLGRGPGNDYPLPFDKAVSQKHAHIVLLDHTWMLEDLGSKNGTYVESNGRLIRISGPQPVANGSLFLIGATQFRVRISQPEDSTTLAAVQRRFVGDEALVRIDSIDGSTMGWQLITEGSHGTRYSLSCPPSALTAIEERFDALVRLAYANKNTPDQRSRVKIQEEIAAIGLFIRDALVPNHMIRRLAQLNCESLLLLLSPSLLGVPWELTDLGDWRLCDRFDMGRQIVLDNQSISICQRSRRAKLRILLIANPTGDLPNAQLEAEEIFESLRSGDLPVEVTFLSGSRVDRMGLMSRLNATDFVYYVGHAEHHATNPLLSCWVLQDDRITAQDFLQLRTPPALVFANACQTGKETPHHDGDAFRTPVSGLASAFISAGVQNYLGTLMPVSAQGSLTFARSFLNILLTGEPIGAAIRKARQAVLDRHGVNDIVWASYVLYGGPSQTLF